MIKYLTIALTAAALAGCGATHPDTRVALGQVAAHPTGRPTGTPSLHRPRPTDTAPTMTGPTFHVTDVATPPRPRAAHPTVNPSAIRRRVAGIITPGAYCSPYGVHGLAADGLIYRCLGPGQLRWRRPATPTASPTTAASPTPTKATTLPAPPLTTIPTATGPTGGPNG